MYIYAPGHLTHLMCWTFHTVWDPARMGLVVSSAQRGTQHLDRAYIFTYVYMHAFMHLFVLSCITYSLGTDSLGPRYFVCITRRSTYMCVYIYIHMVSINHSFVSFMHSSHFCTFGSLAPDSHGPRYFVCTTRR